MNRKALCILFGLVFWGLVAPTFATAEPLTAIIQAQRDLKKLGYYTSRVDGIVGPLTQRALVQFQYEMNLPVSGTLDNATLEYLGRPSVILNTQDFAPFHYKTSRKGEAYGPVPQIVKQVCQEAGINCRVILYDKWRLAQEDVRMGKSDGMFVIAWNSKRAKWLHRSTAIIETEYGFFSRNEDDLQFNPALLNSSSLEGYTVGVYGPSGTASSLNKLKTAIESRGVKIFINMEGDDKPLFKKLSASSAKYAVYSNRIVGETIIRGLGLTNTRYAGMHRKLSYYVGFSKQRVPLNVVHKFNEAYFRLVNQGTVMAILANHSMPTQNDPKPDSRTKALVAAPRKVVPKRFSQQNINGTTVVVDATTCLMWQQSGIDKHCNWSEAVAYVEELNREKYAGYADWRLPTIGELKSLIENDLQKQNRMYIHPIFDALQQTCWSAEKSDLDIQFVDFFDGEMGSKDQNDTNFVRAVRTGECYQSN